MYANKPCPYSHYRIAAGLTVKFYEAEFIKFLIIMKIQISPNEQCIKEEKTAKFLGLQIFSLQNRKSCIELILPLSNNLYSEMSQISR
jgi:hypothetical protein